MLFLRGKRFDSIVHSTSTEPVLYRVSTCSIVVPVEGLVLKVIILSYPLFNILNYYCLLLRIDM